MPYYADKNRWWLRVYTYIQFLHNLELIVMPAISRPGPTSREWAQHREVISRLYWDEDKTLKQVVDYMRSHHGFQAT